MPQSNREEYAHLCYNRGGLLYLSTVIKIVHYRTNIELI